MSTISKLSLKNIVSPSTRVIIWISEKAFHKSNDLYNEFNYIFNGLFDRGNDLQAQEAGQTNLFTTQSFGKELYLYRAHPQKVDSIIAEVQKKAQEGINAHTLLTVDTDLESSFYKISKEFEHISNLEIHLTKDLIE